ncbi:amino-acid permease bat1 [Quercus suber]|uniref:Amino-acid permease bat1 n=1 Tax=Quercus suber TaxID=58331 RepID=A0AAW0LRS9_QUESU
MVYGWPIVGVLTLIVGLSMAEICSAFPTSGGLYFWSAKLCGSDWGPFASWITGWYVIVSVYQIQIGREKERLQEGRKEIEHLAETTKTQSFASSFSLLTLLCCEKMVTGIENGSVSVDSGHARLHELGYKQELKRDLSVVSNFAFSFSIISVLTGVTTLYNTGLTYGGPVSLAYGWLIAGAFTMIVGLSMSEICSSYQPLWAVTTSIDYSLAQLISVIILLSTGGNNGGDMWHPNMLLFVSMGQFYSYMLLSTVFLSRAAAWNLVGMKSFLAISPFQVFPWYCSWKSLSWISNASRHPQVSSFYDSHSLCRNGEASAKFVFHSLQHR